jgi:hypothetical protein
VLGEELGIRRLDWLGRLFLYWQPDMLTAAGQVLTAARGKRPRSIRPCLSPQRVKIRREDCRAGEHDAEDDPRSRAGVERL